MRILWLASWYPNKLTPYNGDFIKRHAEAVSIYEMVDVFHVIRDVEGIVTKKISIEKFSSSNLTETIIYYYSPILKIHYLDKFISYFLYLHILKKNLKKYFISTGTPDIVHVHIVIKMGSIARWIKKHFSVQYLVTEHWTGFLPESDDSFNKLNSFLRAATKKTFKNATSVSTVSDYLGMQLKKQFSVIDYIVIPNVVNTCVFFPKPFPKSGVYNFIHISGLNHQKNFEILIKAIAILKNEDKFRLTVVGPFTHKHLELAKRNKVDGHIDFFHEMPQPPLAELMQKTDALILFSRYETFGCVLIEANACGLPVLVSNLPVFYEIVHHGINGIISKENTHESLAQEMMSLIKNEYVFSNSEIAENAASLYNYEAIGKKFCEWYKKYT